MPEISCGHLRGFQQLALWQDHGGNEGGGKTIGRVRKRAPTTALYLAGSYGASTLLLGRARHPFHATEEAYHYDKPMNGLENGERGRRGGRRLTHTLIAQWRLPSFLPSFSDAAFIAVAAWKEGRREGSKENRFSSRMRHPPYLSRQARIFSVHSAGENASVLARTPSRSIPSLRVMRNKRYAPKK